jgi:hypothetical protein
MGMTVTSERERTKPEIYRFAVSSFSIAADTNEGRLPAPDYGVAHLQ